MDRQALLEHFSAHYCAYHEVASKLPLHFSAEPFWQELVNRRKMKASVLPLRNAQGMPYWFVLTEKTAKASEALCDEAIHHEGFDPYRMEMTSAMTWEMLFTSYVEGEQIDMDEALDYLGLDIEPTNAQEQLLWNNRQALCALAGGLFRTLDETFLGQLAYLLTQGMDEPVTGYRLTDTHPIAAMAEERYAVPSALEIPERMAELCSYLARPDVHPLIKAAVAQAYILTTRPYPEGNERLARMVSTLVLYRSGYDYFCDISISKKIAQESYLYYKNMREILKPENSADLTYFVEYYIDLLARALQDSKTEATRRESEQEATLYQAERRMAMEPLEVSGAAEQPSQERPENPTIDIGQILAGAKPMSHDTQPDLKNPGCADELGETFWSLMDELMESGHNGFITVGKTASAMVKEGCTQFTIDDWCARSGVPRTTAKNHFTTMRKYGVIKEVAKKGRWSRYQFIDPSLRKKIPVHKGKDAESTGKRKPHKQMLTDAAREQRYSETVKRLKEAGLEHFTSADWADMCGVNKSTADKNLRDAIGFGLIYRTGTEQKYTYHIGTSPTGDTGLGLSPTQMEIYEKLMQMQWESFTASDAALYFGMSLGTFKYHLGYIIAAGKGEIIDEKSPKRYRIKRDVSAREPAGDAVGSEPQVTLIQPRLTSAGGRRIPVAV